MATLIDRAWAAGLFEGEGYLSLVNERRGIRQAQVGLNMCDEDVVQRFASIVGVGTIRVHTPKNPKHRTQYRWRACSWADVTKVVTALRPWLAGRRLEQVAAFEVEKAKPREPRTRREDGTYA